MEKSFQPVEIEVIVLEDEDVICTSVTTLSGRYKGDDEIWITD